ncbi:MAG: POT family MFS transporter [Planctomycetaceae bacterium]|nr:POT family MFS transporter [Planctomycetaceae bacterium]
MANKYLTAPEPITTMPPGIPYIVGNEAAERFSYYGMVAILTVFMTKHLLNADGQPDYMSEPEAREMLHSFKFLNYFFPIIGALLADSILGKYRTIIWLSLGYCFGHLVLGLDHTRWGLGWGLLLIAIGSGGIKPCVSAHVGDQFGPSNAHLIERVFGWFYFAINFGSMFSTLLTPWLLEDPRFGPKWAFGVPGVLMALATFVFWLGRNRFVHVPPGGMRFVREVFGPEGFRTVMRLIGLFSFMVVFWALYDQTHGAWVLQADKMDRHLSLGFIDLTPNAAQFQAINPVLVLLFIPLFSFLIYPAVSKYLFEFTPLRRVGVGLFLMVAAYCIPYWIERQIEAGLTPHINWQLLAYVVLTASEVLVSITMLEFSYTQALKTMKSVVMALNLLSVAFANLFVALVNKYIKGADGQSLLEGSRYYLFFTAIMLVASILFVIYASFYRGQTYIQDSAPQA